MILNTCLEAKSFFTLDKTSQVLKFPPLKSLLENRSAEVQVVLLICALGTLRMVIALVFDLLRPNAFLIEVITDLGFFAAFLFLLVLAKRKLSFQRVHPLFGVIIILLLAINFLEFGGVAGTNGFNYYAGIYVTVMLFSGRTLYTLIGFQLLLLLLLMYLVLSDHPVYQTVLIGIDYAGPIEFIFSALAIAVFTFYLKRVTISEIEKHQQQNQELGAKVAESKRLNQQLVEQAEQLKKAQQELNEEVARRVFILETRKEAIEQYIHHNTTTLKEPLMALSHAVEKLKGNSQLDVLLRLSNAELNQVVSNINAALQSDEQLNRNRVERK